RGGSSLFQLGEQRADAVYELSASHARLSRPRRQPLIARAERRRLRAADGHVLDRDDALLLLLRADEDRQRDVVGVGVLQLLAEALRLAEVELRRDAGAAQLPRYLQIVVDERRVHVRDEDAGGGFARVELLRVF